MQMDSTYLKSFTAMVYSYTSPNTKTKTPPGLFFGTLFWDKQGGSNQEILTTDGKCTLSDTLLRFVNNYDPSVKHRICEFEIYSLNSNSWTVVDDFTPDWGISFTHRGLSLKGNTYWYAQEKIPLDGPPKISELPDFVLCFDFTTERFGPRLPLPFNAFFGETVTLSSVREEQLTVLLQKCGALAYTVKIWITTKIEPNAVSWSNLFLAVDMKPLIGFLFSNFAGSFFVDEEKEVAPTRNVAYISGNKWILANLETNGVTHLCALMFQAQCKSNNLHH